MLIVVVVVFIFLPLSQNKKTIIMKVNLLSTVDSS